MRGGYDLVLGHISPISQAPLSLQVIIAQSLKPLRRYHRGQSSNPGKSDFFRLSFRNCMSCVFNCNDLLCIYFDLLPFY